MQIIDGYCGFNNVFADDIGQYNIAVFGSGDYVLPTGEKLGYELVSNNEIKIKDGLFITQGRRGVLKKGTTESCVIENGTQAENRNDLIVVEYAKDESTMVESHTLKVIKGTPGVAAADPTTITGNIPGGAVKHQMLLYRVRLEGLNVVGVDQLFRVSGVAPETLDTMAEIEAVTEPGMVAGAKAVKELSSNLDELNARTGPWTEIMKTNSSTPVNVNLTGYIEIRMAMFTPDNKLWNPCCIEIDEIIKYGSKFVLRVASTTCTLSQILGAEWTLNSDSENYAILWAR